MSSAKELHQSGISQFRAGNTTGALAKLQEALAAAPENSRLQAEIYNDLGVVYRELKDYDAAFNALDEAMAIFNELEDARGQAQALGNLGALLEAEEDYEAAVNSYKQSAKMLEELGESEMAMYVWQAISRLRTRQGQYIAAIGAYEEGVENMPKGFKRSALEKLLKMPGKLLGGAAPPPAKANDNDET
ncbi:MAG: hypothetical protein Kow0031_21730 [Anaerolineae bacterium]